jgi:glycosyltransferase involved in cell wall biosynthesis
MQHPLPPPLDGKTGWPWDFKPPKNFKSINLPRITIVTPSYNQASYLEETIRSVLLQDYSNLEYFVIDGGSTDGSVEIIKKYEKWLAGWVSEKDHGQSHAINKGFVMSTGEWLGWLNSDDCYAPSALFNLVSCGLAEKGNLVVGESIHFGEKVGKALKWITLPVAVKPETYARIGMIIQPTAIWKRSIFEACGPLSENLHYAMDWEFFIKCSQRSTIAFCDDVVAVVRHHNMHKSGSGKTERWQEIYDVHTKYLPGHDKILNFMRGPVEKLAAGRGLFPFAARRLRQFFFLSKIYTLWGLPVEVWIMEEALFIDLKSIVKKEFTEQPVYSVAEAIQIDNWHD